MIYLAPCAAMASVRLSKRSTLQRRLVLMALDALVLALAVWLSFLLRLAQAWHYRLLVVGMWLLPAAVLMGLPVFSSAVITKGLSRYVGSHALYELSARTGLINLLLAGLGWSMGWPVPPRSSWVLFGFLLAGFSGALSFALRHML